MDDKIWNQRRNRIPLKEQLHQKGEGESSKQIEVD